MFKTFEKPFSKDYGPLHKGILVIQPLCKETENLLHMCLKLPITFKDLKFHVLAKQNTAAELPAPKPRSLCTPSYIMGDPSELLST